MLDLSNVTLVSIDSAADHLSKNNIRLAIMSRVFPKIIEKIKFGDILFINPFNKNSHLIDEKFETLWDYDFDNNPRNVMWYSNFVIGKLPFLIKTDYYLIIQWDGFPILQNPKGSWKNEFFDFEFLGGGHSLFNGGFSLRKTETMRDFSKLKDSFGSGAEDGFYSSFFDNIYNKHKNTPFKIKWDDGKVANEFCSFLEFDKNCFGWHRSGFLSNINIKRFYSDLECFSNNELSKILEYISAKEIQKHLFVDNYMEYFDIEYNQNFYNY